MLSVAGETLPPEHLLNTCQSIDSDAVCTAWFGDVVFAQPFVGGAMSEKALFLSSQAELSMSRVDVHCG